MEACRYCRFWVEKGLGKLEDGKHIPECRRNPPQVIASPRTSVSPLGVPLVSMIINSYFPVIDGHLSCGCFEPNMDVNHPTGPN